MKREEPDGKPQLADAAAIDKVRELLPKFETAMMITHGEDGGVHARPLGLQGDRSSFGGTLWFFADARSRTVDESARGVPVSLVCQNDAQHAYLHLTGSVSVSRDKSRMRELYSPILKTWFPDGLDDPNLTLLRFDAAEGAFWDSPGGSLQLLAAFAKAVITGSPGKGGESGELHM